MDYTYQQATNRFRYRIVHASFPVMLVRGLAPCVVVVENSHREHPRHTETDDLGGPEHRGRGRGDGYRCLGAYSFLNAQARQVRRVIPKTHDAPRWPMACTSAAVARSPDTPVACSTTCTWRSSATPQPPGTAVTYPTRYRGAAGTRLGRGVGQANPLIHQGDIRRHLQGTGRTDRCHVDHRPTAGRCRDHDRRKRRDLAQRGAGFRPAPG